MKAFPYAPPLCEYDNYFEATALLTGSDLTDEGAGDFLLPGDDFTL